MLREQRERMDALVRSIELWNAHAKRADRLIPWAALLGIALGAVATAAVMLTFGVPR